MEDLSEALERAAQFTRFENQQRYMRWMIAMRREILQLRARDSRDSTTTESLPPGNPDSDIPRADAREPLGRRSPPSELSEPGEVAFGSAP